MRIENRFGSLEIAKENEEIVKEFALGAARALKYAMISMLTRKSVKEGVDSLRNLASMNGSLPFDWFRDAVLAASGNGIVNAPRITHGDVFQRTIGNFTVKLFLDDEDKENRVYVVEIWGDLFGVGTQHRQLRRCFPTEDDAIREYFNVKDYMHLFCEKVDDLDPEYVRTLKRMWRKEDEE